MVEQSPPDIDKDTMSFIAPLSCVGLYAISAQLERGLEPSMASSLRAAFNRHVGNEMIFASALLIVFLVWSRAAVIKRVWVTAR